LPCSAWVSKAAKDQSGSAEAAITRMVTPSQSGAFMGLLRSSGAALATSSVTGMGTALSGPVTESNGFRAKMGSALVACGLAELRGDGARAARGAIASSFSVTAKLPPTICVIPCAPRNAAMATSTRMTAQK